MATATTVYLKFSKVVPSSLSIVLILPVAVLPSSLTLLYLHSEIKEFCKIFKKCDKIKLQPHLRLHPNMDMDINFYLHLIFTQ